MTSKLSLFLDELKRRKVYHVAAVYAAVGVAISLGIPDLFNAFDLPNSAARFVIVLIIIGFPIALVLAWAYEVKPEEPQSDPPSSDESSAPPEAATPTPESSAEQRRSVAVLPFLDMSPKGDQEYFGDGVAEEVLNVLTRIPDLRVAARTSSFSYKGKGCGIREMGQELGVGTVLEGSVRKAGDRLRITAQLTETSSGFHLWSETYERKDEDVFAIQDDIARAIADTLRVTLLGKADGPLVRAGTESPEAYDCYLKGRHRWVRRYKYGLQTALEFFRAAIEKDPDYALPYAGVADVHTILAIYGLIDNAEARSVAVEAAERAMALDPELAEAYFSNALVQAVFSLDFDAGDVLFQRALELDPDLAAAHVWKGMGLAAVGERVEEGLDSARRGCALESDSPYIQGVAGITHIMDRRYPEAIAHFQQALDLEPDDIMALYGVGISHSALGAHNEAISFLEKAAALSNRMSWVIGLLSAAYSRAGMVAEALAILEELRGRANREHVTPVAMAVACANNSLPEEALDYLEQALAEAKPTLTNLIRYPVWDTILSNPRYTAVVAGMNWKPWDPPSAGNP